MRIFKLISITFFLFVSCTSFNNESPKVDFRNNEVIFHNLIYKRGITGMNSLTTNIRDFDVVVWEDLRRVNGIYSAYRIHLGKDQYGNEIREKITLGNINLDELNKYKTLDDFKASGGVMNIIPNTLWH